MWLLPAFSPIARLATGVYYRLRVEGESVPPSGPVLLVANHPNSLLDPALVVAVAGRPVRFLAKAPLFTDPLVGWLVRGAGAIPVHRREDDRAAMVQNIDAFAAVFRALGDGAAVGIFPEGVSHDAPALAPLRTGAARIALGAAQHGAGIFPIVPVGLLFRDKERFRSAARVVIGPAVTWADLAAAGEADAAAVRALTVRIEDALRDVTLNLESWADAPLVEAADAIWAAEFGGSPTDADRLLRLRLGTARLAALRRAGDAHAERVAREVLRHARLLDRLGMTPAELHGDTGSRDAAGWALRRLPLAAFAALGWLGAALFWPPWRLTGVAAEAMKPEPTVRSTTRLLLAVPIYAGWLLLLALAAGVAAGAWAAAAAALLLPAFGLATLRVREEWRAARRDARRFLLKRGRRRRVAALRARQQRLAAEIARTVQGENGPVPAAPPPHRPGAS